MTETAAVRTGNRVFIDKQHPDAYRALAATAQAAKDAAAAAGLDRTLVELVNLRVSQLNAYAYCLDLHTRAALRAGETTQGWASWRPGATPSCSPPGNAPPSPWPRPPPAPPTPTPTPRPRPTRKPAPRSPTTRSPR